MKTLIVAHPDDEILWFNPQNFDRIVIVFGPRRENFDFSQRRVMAINEHPLRNKIISLNIVESGLVANMFNSVSQYRKEELIAYYHSNFDKLKLILPQFIEDSDEVYTHNELGEYGHPEHVAINLVVYNFADKIPVFCPANMVGKNTVLTMPREEKIDIDFFERVKAIYKKYDVWTFNDQFRPKKIMKYYQEEKDPNHPRITKIIV